MNGCCCFGLVAIMLVALAFIADVLRDARRMRRLRKEQGRMTRKDAIRLQKQIHKQLKREIDEGLEEEARRRKEWE